MRPLFLFLLLSPVAAPAQGATEAAKSFLSARARRDWVGMVEFVDSAAHRAIRAIANRAIEQLALVSRPDVRQTLQSAGADAPLRMMDVASSMLGTGSFLRYTFADVTDSTILRSLSDDELVARWFQAKDPSYITRLMMNGMLGEIIARAPGGERMRRELDATMRQPTTWDVVGFVQERQTAHVIYRMTAGGPTGVLSFREHGGRWFLDALDPSDQVDQLGKLEMAVRQAQGRR